MSNITFEHLVNSGFLDSSLFQEAITHRSAGGKNNERLEFLGDSVLDLIVAEYLFVNFPDLREGELSRIRSHLVKKDTLAVIAGEIDLGKLVILGPGELKSGGQQRDTILANTLEAVIGAIYLDQGLDEAKRFIFSLFETRISGLPSPSELKDPKSQLQEYLQANNLPLAHYTLVHTEGASHAQSFESLCVIEKLSINTSAWGSSKRKAEQASARKALDLIRKTGLG
jgi:ribonuclease-3